MKQLLTHITEDLHTELKVHSAKTGKTIKDIVATAIKEYLKKHSKEDLESLDLDMLNLGD